MGSRPPPRFVVRRHDEVGSRRRRVQWAAAWLASVLLTAWLVALLIGHRTAAPAAAHPNHSKALQRQVTDLQQQVANLQRAAQVDQVATKALHGTLSQRESELSNLRADLGFYARLVDGDSKQQSLKLQEVKLQPIADTGAWNLTLSLTQNARHDKAVAGNVSVSVEGLRGDKVVTLNWAALGDAAKKDGMPFSFLYFQQLHGTIVLPAGFSPTRLRIHIKPKGDKPQDRAVAWNAALSGNITTAQGDQDAEP